MLRQRNFLLAALVAFFLVASARAQEPIRFARTPDISPDGKLVAFSYLGDVWVVEAIGGRELDERAARPIVRDAASTTMGGAAPSV